MKFHHYAALTAATLIPIGTAFTPASTSGTDKLARNGLANLVQYSLQHPPPATCSLSSGYIRKEWTQLSSKEKSDYIAAVRCLQTKPSKYSGSVAGAKTRYDDFVAVHINQTLTIHGTGNFLSWHRLFTWSYEQALRNECGYKGYQPYLNWGRYAFDILNAPVFDGSSTSMTGNGAYVNHSGANIPSDAAPFITIPPGPGGGCVTNGPFANMSVNLGPVAPALKGVNPNPSPSGLGYNPRCLRRDISTYAASTNLQDANSTDLISNYKDILSFQNRMQGDFPNRFIGVHTAGHFVVGGDPGGDLFASPGDPYFFLHHAQIDRTWWIWQNQDLKQRQNAIAGTLTLFNSPPSRNTSLDDVLDMGLLGPSYKIGETLSTISGPFCYSYADSSLSLPGLINSVFGS